jgi:hypothetical protein
MRVSLIIALSVVGVFSLLAFLPLIQESYQQLTSPCSDSEIAMRGPQSAETVCIAEIDEGKYRSEGYVPLERIISQGSVPDWVKNTATWYGDGSVSQAEFVAAMKHLIDNKVIKLSSADDVTSNMLKSKHKVSITDMRFLKCLDLHDAFLKMTESEYHDVYPHIPFLNICIGFYKDPVWASSDFDNTQALYQSFQKYASTDADKSSFQQCMMIHRFYETTTESQFLSKFADKDYIDDCVTLYKDPIWQYDEKDRIKKLYSRFVEIETARTGQSTPTHTVNSEISYIKDLGDGAFEIQFNACAGDTVIHHAKFLIKSSTDSIQIGSYKDLEANSCRTYSATIHAENSNDIQVHLMEAVEKDQVETQDDIKPLSCAPGWVKITSADGEAFCKAKSISQLVRPTPGGVGG